MSDLNREDKPILDAMEASAEIGAKGVKKTAEAAAEASKLGMKAGKVAAKATVASAKVTSKLAVKGVLNALKKKGISKDANVKIKVGNRNAYIGKTDGSGFTKKALTSKEAQDLNRVLTNPSQSKGAVSISVDKKEVYKSRLGKVERDNFSIAGMLPSQDQKQGAPKQKTEPKQTPKQAAKETAAPKQTPKQEASKQKAAPKQGASKEPEAFEVLSLKEEKKLANDKVDIADAHHPKQTPKQEAPKQEAPKQEAPKPPVSVDDLPVQSNPVQHEDAQGQQDKNRPAANKLPDDLKGAVQQPSANEQRLMAKIDALTKQVSALTNEVNTLRKQAAEPPKPPRVMDRIGNWIQKQRNSIANQLYKFGDKLATDSQQLSKGQAPNRTSQKDLKELKKLQQRFKPVELSIDKALKSIDAAQKSVDQNIADARTNMNQKLDRIQGSMDSQLNHARSSLNMGNSIFEDPKLLKENSSILKKAKQNVTKLINSLGKDEQIKVGSDGSRTWSSRDYNWTLTQDNKLNMMRKSDGTAVTPKNMSPNDRKVSQGLATEIGQKIQAVQKAPSQQMAKQKIGR